jgi:hypothetical protein
MGFVNIIAAILFLYGALRLHNRGDFVGTVIYCVTGIVFLIIAFGHHAKRTAGE